MLETREEIREKRFWQRKTVCEASEVKRSFLYPKARKTIECKWNEGGCKGSEVPGRLWQVFRILV